MPGPYTISTPAKGQPIPSAGFGQAVKDAINDLHSRASALEVNTQAVIAWGRRTTSTGGSANTTEIPVMRLDNIPVRSGAIYQVTTGPVFATSSVPATPNNDGMSVIIRYNLNVITNQFATSASSKVGHFRIAFGVGAPTAPSLGGFFTSNLDGYVSIYLGFFRNSGSNTLSLTPTGSDPLDIFVQYGGAAPTASAVIL